MQMFLYHVDKFCYYTSMKRLPSLITFFKSWYYSHFPDPNETRLQIILGASVLTIGTLRHNERQFTLMLRPSQILKSERFRRTVIDNQGAWVNDVGNAIMLMPSDQRMDIVREIEQDEQLAQSGLGAIKFIPTNWLSDSAKVKSAVLQFI